MTMRERGRPEPLRPPGSDSHGSNPSADLRHGPSGSRTPPWPDVHSDMRGTPPRLRRTSWTILLAVVLAVVVAWWTVLETPRVAAAQHESPPDRARVVSIHPAGDAESLDRIELVFDRPVAPPGRVGAELDDELVQLEPRLRGRLWWSGMRSLIFEPASVPPPGTVIRVTLDSEARRDPIRPFESESWEIRYRRPRLEAVFPSDATAAVGRGFQPTVDPILLAFTAPTEPESAERIDLTGDDGSRFTLEPVEPPLELLREVFEDATVPENVLALQPPADLPAGSYRLTIGPELRFEDSALSLQERHEVRFDVAGNPRAFGAVFRDRALEISFTQAVGAEAVRRHLRLDPPASELEISVVDGRRYSIPGREGTVSGSRRIRIRGPFPAGENVRVTLTEGLPDVYGNALERPLTFHVDVPHEPALLDIIPGDGVVIPSPYETFEVHARNVREVAIHAAWIGSDDVPALLRGRGADRFPPIDAWPGWNLEEIWSDPADQSDTLLVWQKALGSIELRPHDAQVLWIEARAPVLYPASSELDTLRIVRLLQVSTLGLHARLGPNHGLLWATDLITGEPIRGADVSLWVEPGSDATGETSESKDRTEDRDLRSDPAWSGTTDENGIVWTPGAGVLGALGEPFLALAESRTRRIWLRLDSTDVPEPDGSTRAALLTDRGRYRAGDALHWKAYVRRFARGRAQLVPEQPFTIRLMRTGDGVELAHESVVLNRLGNGHGSILLPSDTRPGTYALQLVAPGSDSARIAGDRRIDIEPETAPPWRVLWDPRAERLTGEDELELSGRLLDRSGRAVADARIDWDAVAFPILEPVPGWESFVGGDTLLTRSSPDTLARDRVRTGTDGRFRIRFEARPFPHADARVETQLRFGTGGASDRPRARSEHGPGSDTERRDFAPVDGVASAIVVRGRPRALVRALEIDSETPATLRWEWTVVEDGEVARGRTVVGEVLRASHRPAGMDSEAATTPTSASSPWKPIARHTFETGADPRIFTFDAPGPGRYAFRLAPEDGSHAASALEAVRRGEAQPVAPPLPVAPSPNGRHAYVTVPATPGPAHVLCVVEANELVRARVATLQGEAEVEVPIEDLPPGHARIDAVVVGPDLTQARRAGPRRSAPYFAEATGAFQMPLDPLRALLDVRIDPPDGSIDPGVSLPITLHLRARGGDMVAGEVALWIVRLEDEPTAADSIRFAEAATPPRDPLEELLLSTHPARVRSWDTRHELRPAPAPRAHRPLVPQRAEPEPLAEPGVATVFWSPSIPIGRQGRTQTSVVLDRPGRYEIRAAASTFGEQFAVTRHRFEVSSVSKELRPRAPDWIRPADQVGIDRAGEPAAPSIVPPPAASPRTHVSTAAPTSTFELDLDDPDLLDAGAVDVTLYPSVVAHLEAPVERLCRMHPTSTEEWISHAFGLLSWLHLDPFLATEESTVAARREDLARAAAELEQRWERDRASMWPRFPAGEEQDYLTGYLYWVLNEVRAHQGPVGFATLEDVETEIHLGLPDELPEDARVLDDIAFHTWLLLEFGSENARPDPIDLEALFIRHEWMGTSGRIYLALAYDTWLRSETRRELQREMHARLQLLLDRLSGSETSVLELSDPGDARLFSTTPGDEVRTSSLGIYLLCRAAPNSALLSQLVHSVLARRIDGVWPNPHEAALAVWALREYVESIEVRRLPLRGRVIPGFGKALSTRFTEDDMHPRTFRFELDELLRIRRPDPARQVLPIHFETDGIEALYYRVSIPRVPEPAAEVLPNDTGISIHRVYELPDGETWHRATPARVRLFVSVPRTIPVLRITEPLLPGAVLVGSVRFRESSGTDRATPRIVATDRGIDRIEIVARHLEPGLHEIMYALAPMFAGRFEVPASIARTPYGPGVSGNAAGAVVRIEP